MATIKFERVLKSGMVAFQVVGSTVGGVYIHPKLFANGVPDEIEIDGITPVALPPVDPAVAAAQAEKASKALAKAQERAALAAAKLAAAQAAATPVPESESDVPAADETEELEEVGV